MFNNFLGMPKFGLRKSGVYSDKSDEEEMDINQENSVEQLRTEASQACATLAGSVDQLRNETSEVCSNIVSGVNENFVSKEDLQRYHEEIMKEFGSYNRAHADIISSLNSLKNATLYFKKELQILSQKGDASNASTSMLEILFLHFQILQFKILKLVLMIMHQLQIDMITITMLS